MDCYKESTMEHYYTKKGEYSSLRDWAILLGTAMGYLLTYLLLSLLIRYIIRGTTP